MAFAIGQYRHYSYKTVDKTNHSPCLPTITTNKSK